MLTFRWNALRTGDRVLVHDDNSAGLDTNEGVVAIVQPRRASTNDVAIRADPTGRVVRLRRRAVHQLPLDRRFTCWRYDSIATASSEPDGLAA